MTMGKAGTTAHIMAASTRCLKLGIGGPVCFVRVQINKISLLPSGIDFQFLLLPKVVR